MLWTELLYPCLAAVGFSEEGDGVDNAQGEPRSRAPFWIWSRQPGLPVATVWARCRQPGEECSLDHQ
jgi:hypothetical protein